MVRPRPILENSTARAARLCACALSWLLVSCTEPSYGDAAGERDASGLARCLANERCDAGDDERPVIGERPDVDSSQARPDASFDSAPADAPEPAQDGGGDRPLERDAAPIAPAEPDDVTPPPQKSDWPDTIVGTYAIRVRFYSFTDILIVRGELSHEIVHLAKIDVDDEGRVWMETQRCRDFGLATAGGERQEFYFEKPEKLPPERFELVYEDGAFRTEEAAPRELGYTGKQPAECTPGARIAARPEQTWLSDRMCECRDERFPNVVSDCRITDPDEDGKPGFTVTQRGVENGFNTVRARDSCQIVNGQLSTTTRRHTGHYIESYDYYPLQCRSGTSTNCDRGGVSACPIQTNPVLFHPLDETAPGGAAWDCAAVMKEFNDQKLFTPEMLFFPATGCR